MKRSESNLHVNTWSAVKRTKRNIESITEVPITKEVKHDMLENTKSSEGYIIQNEETILKCQFVATTTKPTKCYADI